MSSVARAASDPEHPAEIRIPSAGVARIEKRFGGWVGHDVIRSLGTIRAIIRDVSREPS
jgi:hypothetical protein